MSYPSVRNNISLELAPHQLHNALYNAQSSCSPYLLPPSTTPIVFDSAVYPSVDCQSRAYFEVPRSTSGASGSIGIYGQYRGYMSTEPNNPTGIFPSLGKPMPELKPINYFGQPQ